MVRICTFDAVPQVRAITPPSWSPAPPASHSPDKKNDDASVTVPANNLEISTIYISQIATDIIEANIFEYISRLNFIEYYNIGKVKINTQTSST